MLSGVSFRNGFTVLAECTNVIEDMQTDRQTDRQTDHATVTSVAIGRIAFSNAA